MSDVLGQTPAVADLPQGLQPLREELLANLVMLAQIPAPTGYEADRVRFMLDRFVECGLSEVATDEGGNAVGMYRGRTGERTIVLVAHLDTIYPRNLDHNVVVQADAVLGPGVGDNALGASTLSMLPTCLEHLGIRLNSNLLLLGTTRSLDRGNHEGLRFHLDNAAQPFDFGICVEGLQLGRLNYFSIGTFRGDIVCDVRPEPSRSYGSESALVVLNSIINRMLRIPIPKRPYTDINLSKISAGSAYDIAPDHAELGFQVISHSDEMINEIRSQIETIVMEQTARYAVNAQLDVFFSRKHGGLTFAHPLVQNVLRVMRALEIEADQGHSPSELSEFIHRDIPAVTLGISRGEKGMKQRPDHILIEPMLRGVAQLIGVLMAIDAGACDGL